MENNNSTQGGQSKQQGWQSNQNSEGMQSTRETQQGDKSMRPNKASMQGGQSGQEGMFDNNTYNLMEQLTEEHKSLWRIMNNYKKDAEADTEAGEFWDYLEKDKQEHIKRLAELLSQRMKTQTEAVGKSETQ